MKRRGVYRQISPGDDQRFGSPSQKPDGPTPWCQDRYDRKLCVLRSKTNEKLPREAHFARPAPPEIKEDRLPDRILVFLWTRMRTDNATGEILGKSQ